MTKTIVHMIGQAHLDPAWFWRRTEGRAEALATSRSTADPAQTVGLAILDDGKYGCDVNGSTVRLTVLRCPPYAYHGPPHLFGTTLRVRQREGRWAAVRCDMIEHCE